MTRGQKLPCAVTVKMSTTDYGRLMGLVESVGAESAGSFCRSILRDYLDHGRHPHRLTQELVVTVFECIKRYVSASLEGKLTIESFEQICDHVKLNSRVFTEAFISQIEEAGKK